MSKTDREQASLDICSHLASSGRFRRARDVGCYIAMDEEVNTWPLIERAWRMKKRVFVPVIGKSGRMKFINLAENSTLQPNGYGLLEPVDGKAVDARNLDIVFTPLVAFDANGNRIGMGGGYFDRSFAFLKNRKTYRRPKLIGLAFDCQKVPQFSASPWDVPLFAVYTESGEALSRKR